MHGGIHEGVPEKRQMSMKKTTLGILFTIHQSIEHPHPHVTSDFLNITLVESGANYSSAWK